MLEFLLSFAVIFLAALPGRTTFILVLLGASTPPWRILLGALPAFLLQCAVAVLAGQALKAVPPAYVHLAAGLLFLFFARKFWNESRHRVDAAGSSGRSAASIFALFFLAELGDVSQLAIAARAMESASPLATYLGAAGAMSLIVVLAVGLGGLLGTRLKPAFLQKIAAGVFAAVGVFLLVQGGWGISRT